MQTHVTRQHGLLKPKNALINLVMHVAKYDKLNRHAGQAKQLWQGERDG